jgi:hypothetical protein
MTEACDALEHQLVCACVCRGAPGAGPARLPKHDGARPLPASQAHKLALYIWFPSHASLALTFLTQITAQQAGAATAAAPEAAAATAAAADAFRAQLAAQQR